MNEVQVFNNKEFGDIRTVTIDGEPWFVGKDVAEILGYSEPRSAVSKKVESEDRGVAEMETPSGKQNMTIINESGLYSLILSSKLPSARKFKKWVTGEVLPQIRKTGSYIDPQQGLLQISKNLIMAMEQQEQKINQIDEKVNRLENDVPLFGAESDEVSNHVKRKGTSLLGGKNSNAYKNKNLRAKVYREIYCGLKIEFGIFDDGKYSSYKGLKRKYIHQAHEFIENFKLPTYLKEQIETESNQQNLEDYLL